MLQSEVSRQPIECSDHAAARIRGYRCYFDDQTRSRTIDQHEVSECATYIDTDAPRRYK